MIDWFFSLFDGYTRSEMIWVSVGFVAQSIFATRFIIQWIASERAKRSVVPEIFWWVSIFGGLTLFAYAIHRKDPVFILGQSTGIIIYARNLWLIYAEKRAQPERS